ncbi:MgtC/SapB family protein [Caldalkalibacillus mannanilyticus]|uniref:MgtC/SapB family protein n=1 Tax=Caldalkalibacillus mannanilyticus TaxID=1418 RepID=UPI0004682643|nr:MgtC/SapB family protein [Caldalkalibacillus mannanilyticus]
MNPELFIKLTIALFLGLLIGIDRQLKHKPLGLKTSMIICVASCLVTIVSIQAAYTFPRTEFMMMDPLRLAAQIVSGIGFLGAGVILRRNNDVISGLTTAAMIWASGGLGIAIGAGFYLEAFYSVLLFILAINLLPNVVKIIGPNKLRQRDLAVKIVVEPNYKMTELLQLIEQKGKRIADDQKKEIKIRHIKIKDLENGNQQIGLTLSASEKEYTTEIYYVIKKIDHVLTVEVEHL